MPLVDVKGVHVNFPFDPYPCQVTYMEKVVECLQKVRNFPKLIIAHFEFILFQVNNCSSMACQPNTICSYR